MIATLKKCGLTENESKIYLTLHKFGPMKVGEIAKIADLHRTYTYDVLSTLRDKGLIATSSLKNIKVYEATDPKQLINYIEDKKQQLQKILPSLEKIKHVKNRQDVQMYNTKEGIKTILDDIIDTAEEFFIVGSTKDQLELLGYYFPNFIRRKKEKRIPSKVITEKSSATIRLQKKDKQDHRELRFFKKNEQMRTITIVYSNKVAIISLSIPLLGLLIENPHLAEAQKKSFSLLWQYATEN